MAISDSGKASASADDGGTSGLAPSETRRVALAAAAGTAVEYYDFTVYGLLSLALAEHFFNPDDPTAALLSTFALFGVAFVLRPVGGIVFGHLGDRLGRQRVLAATILAMTGSTFVIGLLPTYGSVGLLAPFLLLLARMVQGLSAGGEASGAGTYVAESAPRRRRAFYASGISGGALFGALVASSFILALRTWLPEESMEDWGWRVPFLVALPIGVIGWWIRKRLEESPQYATLREKGEVDRAPIATIVTVHRVPVIKTMGLALFPFAGYYVIYIYMPTYLVTVAGFDPLHAFWSSTVTLLVACASTPVFTLLSDRIGRKPVFVGACVAAVVVLLPAFQVMNTGYLALAIAAQVVVALPHAAAQSIIVVSLTEQFPATVRYSGVSLGYNLASVLAGGTAPYVATWLVTRTGSAPSPAFFVMAAAMLTLVAVLTLRETAGEPLPET